MEGVAQGVQKRGHPTLLGSLATLQEQAELVSAANQVANPLYEQQRAQLARYCSYIATSHGL